MKELKIVQLLKTFSQNEVKMFKKFASSPYFNEGRNHLPLINELIKYYPGFNTRGFSKEKIFSSLYPEKKYAAAYADKHLSRAARLANKFLLQIAFENESFLKNITHAREYNKRKLDSFFLEQLSLCENDLANSSAFNEDFFDNKLELETVRSGYFLSNKEINKFRDYLLARSDYALLNIIQKYIYCKQDIHLARYDLNIDMQDSLADKAAGLIDLDALVKKVKNSENRYSYVLEYKYYELAAMLDLNIKNYERYRQILFEHIGKFTWREKYNALGAMLSICIMGARSGNPQFDEEAVIACKKMLDENSYSFYEKSFANTTRYFNMLTTFIKNNQTRLIDGLIDKFGKRLAPEHMESMINFSYMNKYFNEKNYKHAITYHAKIDYNHGLLKLNVRILLLKIYYELGYMEEAESLIDTSLKYYSTLTGVSAKRLDRVVNLTKYVKKLLRLKETSAKVELGLLFGEIEGLEDINSKSWLLEKIKEAVLN